MVAAMPLPEHQTVRATRDPLPVSSPRATEETGAARAQEGAEARTDAFRDYLDQGGITVLEDLSRKRQPSAADLISQQSVYAAPGVPLGL
ncbi:hypothetical protein [uncultured Methylobacterium sp.]|jgi:hypothetical protein|uniref:hypothetical protein n=1 Tax=uncultured Methylobacterium sp. TaxID=157278 RepID=UPI002602A11B|nr:hypothetical protein [uncultured Methylobacterium sp.]